MKNQFVKEGLIEARVNKFVNISQKIKQFINQKSINSSTPFYRQDENDRSNNKAEQRAKRSLTDWRQLYIKNNNKIKPQNANYSSNPDHFKARCSVTGHCQRTRKVYTVNKLNTTVGDRHFFTRQSKRSKNTDSKRQSLIDFALAQNCYEKQILKDQKNLTAKQKRFYNRKKMDSNNIDFMKVGQYLSHISEFRQEELKQLNATQKYINNMKEFEFVKMTPYNLAKIKQKFKIDNTRYLQPNRIQHSQNGLRYYERAS